MDNQQYSEKLDNHEEINNVIFNKKVYSNKFSNKLINFVVRKNIMTKENALLTVESLKNNFDIFSIWISQLSWGKFIFVIILFNMCSNMILNTMNEGIFHRFFDNITTLFIFCAIGIKIFLKNKIKSEAQIKEAQLIAEKEMLQRQLIEAKIQTMQAQIEPHFLFNTLSSLDYLIVTDQKKASKMLLSLVTYLRYALPQIRENQSFNSLGKEIENIKAYLNIMEIRMGDRINVNYHINENLNKIAFPSMTLQPIVENAIKYGVEESIDGATITISANYNNDTLEVCVSDTGPGLDLTKDSKKQGNGIALKNIRERLAMLYNDKANLTIMNNSPRGVIVKIAIPINE